MGRYLLITSRDPFTDGDVEGFWALAGDLVARGHPVTLVLIQNGVLAARNGRGAVRLTRLTGRGVEVVADDFSLRERGIAVQRLAEGVRPASVDHLVDALAAGARALWL